MDVSTKFRYESIQGITLDVLKSGLQKYIRRSNREKAMLMAGLLDSFYYAEGNTGERIRTNFIHRLMIIFLEDIGFPGMKYWKELDYLLMEICLKGRKSPARNRALEIKAIKRVIEILTDPELEKARSCSHLRAFCESSMEVLGQFGFPVIVGNNGPVDLSNYFCRLGFAKYLHGLDNKNQQQFDILSQYYGNLDIIRIGRKWSKEIKTKEQFCTWAIILTDIVFNPMYKQTRLDAVTFNPVTINGEWPVELFQTNYVPEDYVLDKHTKNGNQSIEYFALISSQVQPESNLVDKRIKLVYYFQRGASLEFLKDQISKLQPIESPLNGIIDDRVIDDKIIDDRVIDDKIIDDKIVDDGIIDDKIVDDGIISDEIIGDGIIDDGIIDDEIIESPKQPLSSTIVSQLTEKESEFGDFKFRIQLTTSKFKTDVYLVEINSQPVIVKGPYRSCETVKQYLFYQEEKKRLGLPIVNSQICYFYPDRWLSGVPLGLRNSLDRNLKYPFLISQSLIPIKDFKLRIHSSKLWPPTEVIDPKITDLHLQSIINLSTSESIDFLNALGFRCKYKLSDLAFRNFLKVSGRVYSIDEESTSADFNLLGELKINNCRVLQKLFATMSDKMHPELVQYLELALVEIS